MSNKLSPGLKISPAMIWISSILLGLLSSVPQLASRQFNAAEAAVNAAITATFALLMWYFNIYVLWRRTNKRRKQGISYKQLLSSLLFGLVVMFVLAYIQQLILSHIEFGPTMLMVEVRGFSSTWCFTCSCICCSRTMRTSM